MRPAPRPETDVGTSAFVDTLGRRSAVRSSTPDMRRNGHARRCRLPARGPGLAGDVARLPSAAVRCRWPRRLGVLAPRLRPLDAARRRRAWGLTSCTARRTRCCRRCSAHARRGRNRSGAVRPQRRRLDRAAARRGSAGAGGRASCCAAHPRRGPVGRRASARPATPTKRRPARAAGKHHDDPTRPSSAGTTSG